MNDAEQEDMAAFIAQHRLRYEETKNPLYVWTTINACLTSSPGLPLPEWCLDYLRSVSENIFRLTCGFDCREPVGQAKRIDKTKAIELVSDALQMPRKSGLKNVFIQLSADVEDMRSAGHLLSGYGDVKGHTSRKGVVTHTTIDKDGTIIDTKQVEAATDFNGKAASSETVRRRTNRGKRLLGIRTKTS